MGLALSLVTAIFLLYAAFLFASHRICISAKTPEAPSLAAKDKHKRQEINETVEGKSLMILSFA